MNNDAIYAMMDACYAWDRFRFWADSPVKEARALVELDDAMARLRNELHRTEIMPGKIDEP